MHEQDGQGGNAWMLYLTGATAKVEELKTAIEAVVVQSKAEHSQEVCKVSSELAMTLVSQV